MPRIIRHRSAPTEWWSPLLAGAALGGIAAWLVLRSRRAHARREPDVAALSERLRERTGADDLRLRSLGQGILELVGSAGEELNVAALLEALAAEPGVSVVVNRVWTRA